MPPLSDIIGYYKSCYQVDFRAISVSNFFGNKVSHQLILESGELLNGKLMQFPVDSIWGEEMEKLLALHSQEKALYCCSFFVSGHMSVFGKTQKVFTPLYIYPVSLLVEEEVYYLVLDVMNGSINPLFLDFIKGQSNDLDLTYDDLDKALPKGYIRFEEIHKIQQIFNRIFPDIDVSWLDEFPKLLDQEALKTIYKKRKHSGKLPLLPGIGIGLMQKPSGSRGILNELGEMAAQKQFSAPVKSLFFQEQLPAKRQAARKVFSPVSLSKNQLGIFSNYEQHCLSVVIGPPGTGKSFTIAALTADLISRGKSVLIAPKNNQAGNVIAQKIEHDFGLKGIALKTSSRSYQTVLQNRLNDIVYGLDARKVDKSLHEQLFKDIEYLDHQINELEKQFAQREEEEIKWGAFFHTYNGSFFQNIWKFWITNKIQSRKAIWKLTNELGKQHTQLNKKVKAYIRKKFDYRLYETLRHERREIQTLLRALQSDRGNLMQEHFDKINFNVVLHALPAWIVNATDVHKVLPLQTGLFDVVIIDEATQCDVASSLPLLQRGRNCIIVGDPKQLRHISFLSNNQQQQFSEKHGLQTFPAHLLNYRKNSLLDIAASAIPSQDQVHLLDEHFRSMPDIIRFSNDHFYNEQLKIMSATPLTLKEKNVFLHCVDGKRDNKGQNEAEAQAIVEHIQSIIEKESVLNKRLCQTIGVLSPFRAQTNLLKRKIKEAIPTKDIKRHQLLTGTPHQFQGEERDVMLLSFTIDPNTHPSSLIYINKADVFNVSITRARSLQHIFVSTKPEHLNPEHLFTKYLQQIKLDQADEMMSARPEETDVFMESVLESLKSWNVDRIYTAYLVAGVEIDIVVVHKGITYCIDLIGYPGDYEHTFPLEQWKMLQRVGVKTFSVPYSLWYLYKKKTEEALKRFLLV